MGALCYYAWQRMLNAETFLNGAGSVFFFFQAEDGIRDVAVTGVQTCALPISISPDGKRVFTHDQDAPRIAVIDTATNKIANWIEVPTSVYASEPTPDGRWLVTLDRGGNAYVMDLESMKIARRLKISDGASEILIRPGGDIAYLSGTGAGKIDVLDLHTWELEKPIELTPGVDGMAWVAGGAKE